MIEAMRPEPRTWRLRVFDAVTQLLAAPIGVISPARAWQYETARKVLRRGVVRRAYVAADAGGPNQRWNPASKSGDSELVKGFHRVKTRARWLVDNDPYIDGGIRTLVNNVVRWGITAQAKVLQRSGKKPQRPYNVRTGELFWSWAQRVNLWELQKLLLRHAAVDGEAFLVRSYHTDLLRREGIVPLWLQVLECDQLDDSVDGILQNGNTARRGIELNAFGEPVAYHFFDKNPADYQSYAPATRRIPAEDVAHVWDRRRASQTRGISWLASVIPKMYDLHEYDDYEMIGAKLAAAFGVFIKQTAPGEGFEPGWTTTTESDGTTKLTDYIEPGRIQTLGYGQDIAIASHNRPGSNYEPFKRSNLSAGARGLGMSYEAFSGDYTGATYSSARTASLEERMGYVVLQELLVDRALIPLWGWFCDWAVLSGLQDSAPGYWADRERYLAHEWVCPRWQWVDPLKDANAAEKKLSLAVTTRTAIAKETGGDIEDIIDRLAWEEQTLAEKGIPSVLAAKPQPAADPADDDKPTQEETDDE